MHKGLSRVQLIDEALSKDLGRFVGTWRHLSHLLLFDILNELDPGERKVSCKLLDSTLLGDLNFITLKRLLLALGGIYLELELVVVVAAQEGDQGSEVVESALRLRKLQLFLVKLHRGVNRCDPLQKVRDLALLALELAEFLVEVEDNPDRFLVELLGVLILAVVSDEGDIVELVAQKLENFDNLRLCVLLPQQLRVLVVGLESVTIAAHRQAIVIH